MGCNNGISGSQIFFDFWAGSGSESSIFFDFRAGSGSGSSGSD